tara:strand:+ start:1271 stop:1522 length:252 start_codon:yes stop_codon:yes gene_type:complete
MPHISLYLNQMDILYNLFEINDKILLNNIATSNYTIESDDEEDEIEYIIEKRELFILKYNKINNRIFRLNNKRYYINQLLIEQ